MSDQVEKIYLCTVDDIAGPGAGADIVQAQLTFFSGILEKLGYLIVSDKDHRQLWAMNPAAIEKVAQRSNFLSAAEFERRFLAWIHINTGRLPEPLPGAAGSWTFEFGNFPVTVNIAGADGEEWRLTVEEIIPCPFTGIVSQHFRQTAEVPAQFGGAKLRSVFKAGHLVREFEDQTLET